MRAKIAAAFVAFSLGALACGGDANDQGAAPDGDGQAPPPRVLTVLGEPITEDAFRREERDRIEEHGYALVCVAGREVFIELLADHGGPTADEERALEILDELCAEARE